jgi:hypothetical protein
MRSSFDKACPESAEGLRTNGGAFEIISYFLFY